MRERHFHVVVHYTKGTKAGVASFLAKVQVSKVDASFVKCLRDEAVRIYDTDEMVVVNWIELETDE